MSDRETVPDPTPSWDQLHGKQWGQTPEPTQEPASKPAGAKGWTLGLLALVVLVAVVLLIVAVARS